MIGEKEKTPAQLFEIADSEETASEGTREDEPVETEHSTVDTLVTKGMADNREKNGRLSKSLAEANKEFK